MENSGNSFDDGLGKGGLHYLYFHPAGADWGPCKAHDKRNKARKYEEGTSAKLGERAANWLRSVWKELRVLLVESQKEDRPE